MARIEKAELKELLEDCFMDVAEVMAGDYSRIEKGIATRSKLEKVWRMADLGEVPTYESTIRVVRSA